MIEAQVPSAVASLSSMLVRRGHPQLRLAPPSHFGRALPIEQRTETNWREDLRFFLTCYAAGFIFFLIMLS